MADRDEPKIPPHTAAPLVGEEEQGNDTETGVNEPAAPTDIAHDEIPDLDTGVSEQTGDAAGRTPPADASSHQEPAAGAEAGMDLPGQAAPEDGVHAGESAEIRVPDEELEQTSESSAQPGMPDEDIVRDELLGKGLSEEEVEHILQEMREQADEPGTLLSLQRIVAQLNQEGRGMHAQPRQEPPRQNAQVQQPSPQMVPRGVPGQQPVSQGVADAGAGISAVAGSIGTLMGTVGFATAKVLGAPVVAARAAAAVLRQRADAEQAHAQHAGMEFHATARPRQDTASGAPPSGASQQGAHTSKSPTVSATATERSYTSPLALSGSDDALTRASENVEQMRRMNRAYASLADENRQYEDRFRSRLGDFAASQDMTLVEAIREMRTGGRAEHLLGEYSDMVDAKPEYRLNRKIQDLILSGFAEGDASFSEQHLAPLSMGPEDRSRYLSTEQRRNDEMSSIMEKAKSRLPVRDSQDNPADAFDSATPISTGTAGAIREATRYDGEHPEIFSAIRDAKLQQIEYQESLLAMNRATTPEEAQHAREMADSALDKWIPNHESIMKRIAEEDGRGHGTEELKDLRQYQERGAEKMLSMAKQVPAKEGEASHETRMKEMAERIKKAIENIMSLLRGRTHESGNTPSPGS